MICDYIVYIHIYFSSLDWLEAMGCESFLDVGESIQSGKSSMRLSCGVCVDLRSLSIRRAQERTC